MTFDTGLKFVEDHLDIKDPRFKDAVGVLIELFTNVKYKAERIQALPLLKQLVSTFDTASTQQLTACYSALTELLTNSHVATLELLRLEAPVKFAKVINQNQRTLRVGVLFMILRTNQQVRESIAKHVPDLALTLVNIILSDDKDEPVMLKMFASVCLFSLTGFGINQFDEAAVKVGTPYFMIQLVKLGEKAAHVWFMLMEAAAMDNAKPFFNKSGIVEFLDRFLRGPPTANYYFSALTTSLIAPKITPFPTIPIYFANVSPKCDVITRRISFVIELLRQMSFSKDSGILLFIKTFLRSLEASLFENNFEDLR